MRKKAIIKTIIAVTVIGSSLSYFIYQAMQSSWAYYYSVDEIAARKNSVKNQSLRIAGRVKKDSIRKNIQKMQLNFTLTGSENQLNVTYKGPVPDNFTEGIEVVVEGRLKTKKTFQADKIITRCESKYRSRVN